MQVNEYREAREKLEAAAEISKDASGGSIGAAVAATNGHAKEPVPTT
jgi:hypothetical protein